MDRYSIRLRRRSALSDVESVPAKALTNIPRNRRALVALAYKSRLRFLSTSSPRTSSNALRSTPPLIKSLLIEANKRATLLFSADAVSLGRFVHIHHTIFPRRRKAGRRKCGKSVMDTALDRNVRLLDEIHGQKRQECGDEGRKSRTILKKGPGKHRNLIEKRGGS